MSVESLESRLVMSSADLKVQIAETPLNTGGKLTYTVSVINLGPDSATAAIVSNTFTFPAGAHVTSATASVGTASFTGNTASGSFGTVAANANVQLTVVVATTAAGTFSDTASASSQTPDPDLTNNTATLTTPITYGPASITLTSSTSAATLNQPVTLTAQVTPTPGFPIAVGTVTFLDGSTSLGSAMLSASDSASIVVPSLGLGIHSITASFGGDVRYPVITSTATPVYSSDLVKESFSGSGKADLTYYGVVPGTNLYGFVTLTAASGYNPSQAIVWDNNGAGFGTSLAIPVPADYFGDGKPAYAIWQPASFGSNTMILYAISSVNPTKSMVIPFGNATDVPTLGDVDGDGKVDFGVFGPDPTNKGLYRYDFLLSSRTAATSPNGFDPNQDLYFDNYGHGFGIPGATPVVADFDGSGHAGLGVYFPSGGVGTIGTFYFNDVPVPKNTTGRIIDPGTTNAFSRTYGFSTDIPMAVDFDGDGIADLAFYGLDPRTGLYRYDILTSSTGFNTTPGKDVYFDQAGFGYGYSASIPIMADYEGNGRDDLAVFQPVAGNQSAFIFQDVGVGHGVVYPDGSPTGLPVTAPSYVLAKKVRGK